MSKKEAIGGLLGKRDALSPITHQQEDIQKEISQPIQKDRSQAIQEDRNTNVQKSIKKATFEMDSELHKWLKMHSVETERNMVDIVEEALNQYRQNIEK